VERATAGLRLTKDEAKVRVKKAPIHRLFRRYDPSNHPLDSLKTHKNMSPSSVCFCTASNNT
jgi:hypothetical protein